MHNALFPSAYSGSALKLEIMYCNYVSLGKILCCPAVCVQCDSHPAGAVAYIWTLGINFVATVCQAQMLVLLENFFLFWGSFVRILFLLWGLMWVNYLENARFLENYFYFFPLCNGRHFKVDCDFTPSCLFSSVLCLNKCQILGCPVNLQLDELPTFFCGGSVFSESTCSFQGLFVVVGFYSCSWLFDFSAFWEKHVGERDCFSFSIHHFSVFRLWLSFFSFPSILPAWFSLPKTTQKLNPKHQWIAESRALLANAWNAALRKASRTGSCFSQRWGTVHWETAASEPGCCFLIAWKDVEWLSKGDGELLCTHTCAVPSGSTAQTVFHLWGWGGWSLSVTENGLQWVCPAPVLLGGDGCWQNHPVSSFYCQLCQVRQPFPSLCSPCCTDGKSLLSSTAKTPDFANEAGNTWAVPGCTWERGKPCWGHAAGSVCSGHAGPAVCQGNACPVLQEHCLLAEEPFHHLHLAPKGVSGWGFGAGQEEENWRLCFCLIWDLLFPQSLSAQQDEKPGLSVFICPHLSEEQADKGQLLFHLLA